jgi:hypothetical protein
MRRKRFRLPGPQATPWPSSSHRLRAFVKFSSRSWNRVRVLTFTKLFKDPTYRYLRPNAALQHVVDSNRVGSDLHTGRRSSAGPHHGCTEGSFPLLRQPQRVQADRCEHDRGHASTCECECATRQAMRASATCPRLQNACVCVRASTWGWRHIACATHFSLLWLVETLSDSTHQHNQPLEVVSAMNAELAE